MIESLKRWYGTYLNNSKAAALIFILTGSSFFIWYAHPYLRPFWIGLTVAYLLDRPVSYLEKIKIPRILGILIILSGLLSVLIFGLCLLPGIANQFKNFDSELPALIDKVQESFESRLNTSSFLFNIFGADFDILKWSATFLSHHLLKMSFSSIQPLAQALAWWIFDLLLFPFITFFFLKDKNLIFQTMQKLLPNDSFFFTDLLKEIDRRMHRYVLGKLIEFLIVWMAAALLFYCFDLRYQKALAFGVGLSTILPYLGVLLISIPVTITAIAQWGCFSSITFWALLSYFILQFCEGNILSSFLCSEAVDLHPLTIVLAVSICGGLWGISGIIFAVPLATLIKLMILAWPKQIIFSEKEFRTGSTLR